MANNYNLDAWRLIENKVNEKIAAGIAEEVSDKVAAAIAEQLPTAIEAALAEGGAIADSIADAVTAHEAKEEGDSFANSHVPAAK